MYISNRVTDDVVTLGLSEPVADLEFVTVRVVTWVSGSSSIGRGGNQIENLKRDDGETR